MGEILIGALATAAECWPDIVKTAKTMNKGSFDVEEILAAIGGLIKKDNLDIDDLDEFFRQSLITLKEQQ